MTWLRNLFGRKPRQAARPARRVRASYDSAQTDDENRKHWANADSLSAKSANSAEIRRTLRERARYERANNCYADGLVTTLANDTMGVGPRLKALGIDDAAARQVELAWREWAEAVGLAEKLRTARQAKAIDGEAFALLVTGDLPTSVKLDVRLLECDQVTTPFWFGLRNGYNVDGIEFDATGKPVVYHILPDHPGDAWAMGEPNRVPARSVLHHFNRSRPGQERGIPELTPALPLFALLRRFTLATVMAAETAANFAAVLESDLPPEDGDVELPPFDAQEIERNSMVALPNKYRMSQFKAEHPGATYEMFKREILREVGRCMGTPELVIANSAAGYNFSSGRMDLQITYRANIKVERSSWEIAWLDRIFLAWLDEAVMVPGLLPAGVSAATIDWAWQWPGAPALSPKEEAAARTDNLANGTATYAQIAAEDGQDWEVVMRQRATERKREMELAEELGLPANWNRPATGAVPSQGQPQADAPDSTDPNEPADEAANETPDDETPAEETADAA